MYSVITICPGQDFQKRLKVLAPLSDINGTLHTESGQLLMPGILYTKQNGSRFSKVWISTLKMLLNRIHKHLPSQQNAPICFFSIICLTLKQKIHSLVLRIDDTVGMSLFEKGQYTF